MLQKDPQLMQSKKYLENLSDDAKKVVGLEIELFTATILVRIYERAIRDKSENALDVMARLWDIFLRLGRYSSGMTLEVATGFLKIGKSLSFPIDDFTIPITAPSRALQFTLPGITPKIQMDMKRFQLERCGPYFDRNIDSQLDERVPFAPDGWQRKVLDAIDKNKSLFVVAPTSAGKTFISFYAMKKVLQANDEDVIVYIAPTKALVNQIAAEIQARFSKSFERPGKSVWSIHTRDYRIHNPAGCQVLVTLPHILQIMLLSSGNADGPSSFSNRLRRVIFDEVHCIGQADDGLVWEQLLLQVPCPIIALSATVGNPTEFSDWLASAQKSNANDLVVVEHNSRYSDLRKFVYAPIKHEKFTSLVQSPDLTAPGLDDCSDFVYVHPVASLMNISRGIPEDLSLEARDCFTLWDAMKKHETTEYTVPDLLSPQLSLPDRIRKKDVLAWEALLKKLLAEWMTSKDSPFKSVRETLTPTVSSHYIGTGSDLEYLCSTALPMLNALHQQDAMPALLFSYDRTVCELLARSIQ